MTEAKDLSPSRAGSACQLRGITHGFGEGNLLSSVEYYDQLCRVMDGCGRGARHSYVLFSYL